MTWGGFYFGKKSKGSACSPSSSVRSGKFSCWEKLRCSLTRRRVIIVDRGKTAKIDGCQKMWRTYDLWVVQERERISIFFISYHNVKLLLKILWYLQVYIIAEILVIVSACRWHWWFIICDNSSKISLIAILKNKSIRKICNGIFDQRYYVLKHKTMNASINSLYLP